MEPLGMNWGIFLINVALLCGWPILSLVTLFTLKRKKWEGTRQALWDLIVIAIPFLGLLVYWIVQPTAEVE